MSSSNCVPLMEHGLALKAALEGPGRCEKHAHKPEKPRWGTGLEAGEPGPGTPRPGAQGSAPDPPGNWTDP
jgi:hypothetical protein